MDDVCITATVTNDHHHQQQQLGITITYTCNRIDQRYIHGFIQTSHSQLLSYAR